MATPEQIRIEELEALLAEREAEVKALKAATFKPPKRGLCGRRAAPPGAKRAEDVNTRGVSLVPEKVSVEEEFLTDIKIQTYTEGAEPLSPGASTYLCPGCNQGGFRTFQSAVDHCHGTTATITASGTTTTIVANPFGGTVDYRCPGCGKGGFNTLQSAGACCHGQTYTVTAATVPNFTSFHGSFKCPSCGKANFASIADAAGCCSGVAPSTSIGTSIMTTPKRRGSLSSVPPPPFPSEEKIKQAKGKRMRRKSENMYTAHQGRRSSSGLRVDWANALQDDAEPKQK